MTIATVVDGAEIAGWLAHIEADLGICDPPPGAEHCAVDVLSSMHSAAHHPSNGR